MAKFNLSPHLSNLPIKLNRCFWASRMSHLWQGLQYRTSRSRGTQQVTGSCHLHGGKVPVWPDMRLFTPGSCQKVLNWPERENCWSLYWQQLIHCHIKMARFVLLSPCEHQGQEKQYLIFPGVTGYWKRRKLVLGLKSSKIFPFP